jgi:hypothetical protein
MLGFSQVLGMLIRLDQHLVENLVKTLAVFLFFFIEVCYPVVLELHLYHGDFKRLRVISSPANVFKKF